MRVDLNEGLGREPLARHVREFTVPVDTAFPIQNTVQELVDHLHQNKISHQVNYFYAVDDDHKLKGVVSTRSLLFNQADTKLNDILDPDVIVIRDDASLEDALKVLGENQLLALPVVDQHNRLKGLFEVIPKNIDYSINSNKKIQNQASRDLFQLIGFSIEQSKLKSSWMEYRYRMPWLACNMIGGLACAAIGEYFETALSTFVILAIFIPLILTLGEAVSMQSMTLSLQFLSQPPIRWRRILKRLFIEVKTSSLIAITSALAISAAYLLLNIDTTPLVAIAASIFISMIASATFGTLFPVALHVLALDPRVAAGPAVLMCTDIVVTTIYLGLATWLLL